MELTKPALESLRLRVRLFRKIGAWDLARLLAAQRKLNARRAALRGNW